MKFAAIAASTLGDNQLVAAVPGKKIRVLAGLVSFSAAVNVKFKSGASTDITGLYYGVDGVRGFALAHAPLTHNQTMGHFETARGEALVLNLSSAVPVGGHLSYEEVM